eukprot:43921-Prorocentrum_lima.AAC.1
MEDLAVPDRPADMENENKHRVLPDPDDDVLRDHYMDREVDAWERHLEKTFGPFEALRREDAPENTLGDRMAKDKTEETEEDRLSLIHISEPTRLDVI